MRTAKIFIDGTEVGSMAEGRYNEIVKEVRSELKEDIRFRAIIVLAVLKSVFKSVYTTIQISALGFFVVAASIVALRPDMVAELISEFAKLEPHQIAAALQRITQIWLLLSVLASATVAVFSQEGFGYEETYKELFNHLVNLRIRETLNVPVDVGMDIKVVFES